jgi:hypothetical protein
MYERQCVGNTINHALPRLHDIEAISRDIRLALCWKAPLSKHGLKASAINLFM